MSESFLVERTVVIRARRETVFSFFTDPERFARWWGPGSTIEGRPGGRVEIRYPGGQTAGGAIEEVTPPSRIVFTYGYDAPDKPIARGGSRVTITLEDHADGTLLRLLHEVGDARTRDEHVGGWRFQLSLFANVAAAEAQGDVAALVDRWFASWSQPDPRAALADVATADVSFRDRFAAISGRDELAAHVAASQVHMPGVSMQREGAAAACQGTVLADWTARSAAGEVLGRGSNVFTLSPDGKLRDVVGVWRG